MKYLVATDGSAHAGRAVSYITKAAHSGDTVYVLMCYQPSITLASSELVDSEYAQHELKVLKDMALKTAEDAKEKILLENKQILPENIVPLSETGDAREVILEVAKDKKVDCIVVGSRGANAFSRAIMGSVSDYVVRNSACSVLIVK